MPLSVADRQRLGDMRSAALAALDFVAGLNASEFVANSVVSAAVERELEIIGEAARKVSSDLRDRHPQVPWPRMVGLRNQLAHRYWEINLERIWVIVQDDLHPLLVALDAIEEIERYSDPLFALATNVSRLTMLSRSSCLRNALRPPSV
jgi:uncharacterized protein with HEPN domain